MMEGVKWFLLAPDFIVTLLAEPHVPICPSQTSTGLAPGYQPWPPLARPYLAGELALGQADLWPLSHLQVSPGASPSHPALNPLPDNYRDGWRVPAPRKRGLRGAAPLSLELNPQQSGAPRSPPCPSKGALFSPALAVELPQLPAAARHAARSLRSSPANGPRRTCRDWV